MKTGHPRADCAGADADHEFLAQIKRITSLCGAKTPVELVKGLSRGEAQTRSLKSAWSLRFARRRSFVAAGACRASISVLNRSEAAARVLEEVALPT